MSEEKKPENPEQKPFEAPEQKDGEKKDAGAQGGCGRSWCANCGKYVISM